jgi:hypothetical protein
MTGGSGDAGGPGEFDDRDDQVAEHGHHLGPAAGADLGVVNQKKLSHKVGASLAVGASMTSAGLLGAVPLVVSAGVVAMASSLAHIYQYFDDYGDKVQLNDLYFLWKAKRIT